MKFDAFCLATGIGSLPHTNPEAAVKYILEYLPDIPHWPQLPNSGPAEGFLNQFMGPLLRLGLVVEKGGKTFFDTAQDDWGAKLAEFYTLYMAATDGDEQALGFFAFPEESARGFYQLTEHLHENGTGPAKFLKGQISGPLTVGLAMTDQDRRAAYYNDQARDVLMKTVALQGLWQARTLGVFGLPVIVFVDDPSLTCYGQSTYITLQRGQIIEELNGIFAMIHAGGAFSGAHVCAGTDWSILFESDAEIVNFDAYEYFSTVSGYPLEIKKYLERGGVLAWGIVPTSEKAAGEDAASLMKLLDRQMGELAAKGIDRQKLLAQTLITPSCGTGTLPMDLAEKIYRLTGEISSQLRTKLAY
jgi:hypothetical protein